MRRSASIRLRKGVFGGRPRQAALLLFSIAVLLAGGAAAVRGQSALSGFDPNVNGIIHALVVQPDGKVLIGGDFTTLSPNGGAAVTRNNIARVNADGTLDTAFNPNANGEVAAIAAQADGKILVGGSFTSIGGATRYFLARLDATNGLADSFNPNPNSDVAALAVQADGKILVGGDFNQANGTPTIGGATRNDIARLDPTTGLADTFNPNAGSTVYTIVVQADGKVLAGGDFNNIGGQTRHHIARLDGTNGLADSFNPNANADVYAIAIQADGKILAGGGFFGTSSIGGQTRNYNARLDATTGLADSFNSNANGQVNALAVQPDGRILVGGYFAGTNSIGGQARSRIARLDPTTGLADSFDPEANGPVLVIAVQADGKVLAGGQFTSISPNGGTAVTRNHVARLIAISPPQAVNVHVSLSPVSRQPVISFSALSNHLYEVDYANSLAPPPQWNILASIPIGSDSVISVTDTNTAVQRFYRVKVSVPGAVGSGWEDGELTTYTQGDWTFDSPAMVLLGAQFDNVYASNGFTLDVGHGFSMSFASATAVMAYIPSSGPAAALNSDMLDPTTTSSGVFGGDVTALALNVDFGDAGLLTNDSGTLFGDLTLCNTGVTGLDGKTIRQLLSIAEDLLGGASSPFRISDIDSIVAQVTGGFEDGTVSSFAQQHIVNGACP